ISHDFSKLLGACQVSVPVGTVPKPVNISVTSLNFSYILKWEAGPGTPPGVYYNVEYTTERWVYLHTLTATSHRSCDLTRFNLSFMGDSVLRVRATVDGQHSEWVQKTFCPYEEGKTSTLLSRKCDVHMLQQRVSTQPSHCIGATAESCQDQVVLSDLDPMSKYCVQVQIIYDMNPRPGEYSDVVCERTGDGRHFDQTAVTIAEGVADGLTCCRFLCPEVVLPPHFKEVCVLPPPSLLPFNPFIYPVSLPPEHCDQVSIIADHRTEEEEEGGCSTT
uniref:Fibronectin type-III domain-containing protein n=1 Tax=Neolamprologus brichardi TaxID=32507 RepID=A0A3Q4N809_NEOBR